MSQKASALVASTPPLGCGKEVGTWGPNLPEPRYNLNTYNTIITPLTYYTYAYISFNSYEKTKISSALYLFARRVG